MLAILTKLENNFDYVFQKTPQMLRVSSLVVPTSLFCRFNFGEQPQFAERHVRVARWFLSHRYV